MARTFLYLVAGAIVLVLAGLLALRIFADDFTEMAFVPAAQFTPPPPVSVNAYENPDMWLSHPDRGATDPARRLPDGMAAEATALGAAVFFIHPTSYFEKTQWNAPLEDKAARDQAERFIAMMASAFNRSAQLWSPRYRQAALGAFLTDKPEAAEALDIAFADLVSAFDHFVAAVPADQPIVLAGHSQGGFHLRRLLAERVAGTPLMDRVAAAYVVGWPVSIERDLPAMGLPACAAPDQPGCVASWQSWAEPAQFGRLFSHANARGWLDGTREEGRPWLCSNPLSGMTTRDGVAEANRGTLLAESEGEAMRLKPALVPARCSTDGVLLIGEPPQIGSLVMPGNNYHVYDIPLFWANLRSDVRRRVEAWNSAR